MTASLSLTYIIECLFPRYEIHLTGGSSGAGKTSFEALLIERWRHGQDIFGYESYPGPWCYVAVDRSLRSIRATLERLDVPVKEWPLLSAVDSPALTSKPKPDVHPMVAVIAAAQSLVPGLEVLWVDGIHSLCPYGKVNDYGIVSEFLKGCTRLCQKHQVTIKALGHATKVKQNEQFLNPRHRFLGSSAWPGYSDTLTIFDTADPEDPNSKRTAYLMPRNAPALKVDYEFAESGKLVELTGAEEFCMDQWLKKLPGGTVFYWADAVAEGVNRKVSRSTVTRWLRRTVGDGRLKLLARGDYQKPHHTN